MWAKIADEYKRLRCLCENQDSGVVVNLVMRRRDKQVFIMKAVPDLAYNLFPGSRELNILAKLRAAKIEGVVRLSHHLRVPGGVLLFFEEQENTFDLFDYVVKHGPLSNRMCLVILKNTIQTLLQLQDMGIVHGDVKDENILINEKTMKTTIIDFGAYFHVPQSGITVPKEQAAGGTRVHMPPEYHDESIERYNFNAGTVWSLGSLLFTMLYGDVPYASVPRVVNANSETMLTRYMSQCATQVNEATTDIIMKCMRREAEKRIRFYDILKHACFDEIKPVDKHI